MLGHRCNHRSRKKSYCAWTIKLPEVFFVPIISRVFLATSFSML